ncbi:UNVERIFIED_CONTAM: hypothetical protein BEN50_09470 [Euhalothece sp. KZN 001]
MTHKPDKIKSKPRQKLDRNSPFPFPQNTPKKMGKSTAVIEKEMKRMLLKIHQEQRESIADEFLKKLPEKGITIEEFQANFLLSTVNPKQMNSEEISKLATYIYQHDPDTFQSVLTQPNRVQFLSSPILSAIVGIMASKWLN